MERSKGSLAINDFSTDRMEVECKKCSRYGCYRRVTLIEKYGSNTVLLDLLALIASDCEFRNKLGNQGCGALYPALDRVQKRNPPLEI